MVEEINIVMKLTMFKNSTILYSAKGTRRNKEACLLFHGFPAEPVYVRV